MSVLEHMHSADIFSLLLAAIIGVSCATCEAVGSDPIDHAACRSTCGARGVAIVTAAKCECEETR